jgi:hypothetical protein
MDSMADFDKLKGRNHVKMENLTFNKTSGEVYYSGKFC